MTDWTWRDKLRYYWRNCVKWYHRDDRNKVLTWALVASVVFVAVAAFGQDARRPSGRLLPPDYWTPPEGLESFETPVPKSLLIPYPECRTGWGMSWADLDGGYPRRRQTWSAWPCGSFWAFRYQEWLSSDDGLIWYYVKLREFWYDCPVEHVDRFPATFEWLLERYPPGSPPAEIP